MPDFEVATNFFLVLTLAADAVVAVVVLLGLFAFVSRRGREVWHSVAGAVGPQGVLVAWIVALVTTAGSLYYSEHLGFVPCELCWYQRIAMYPLAVILGCRFPAPGPQGVDHRAPVRGRRRAVVAVPLARRARAELRGELVVLAGGAVLDPVLREARVRDPGVDVHEQLPADREPPGSGGHVGPRCCAATTRHLRWNASWRPWRREKWACVGVRRAGSRRRGRGDHRDLVRW